MAPGPEAGTLLAKVARTLEQNPAFDLLIEGHADPSERDAPKLCAARAAAVKKALLAHGVRCGLLTASMGADCPVAPNSTAHELAPWVLLVARSICLDDLCLQLGRPAFHDELLLHLGLTGASRCGPLL